MSGVTRARSGPGRAPRRRGGAARTGLAAVLLSSAVLLSACLFAYDAPKPTIVYRNDSSEGVIVVIERAGVEIDTVVPSGETAIRGVDECSGTTIRVDTEVGELVGRVEEPACPGWRLTITEDGTLEYTEQ